MEKYSNETLNDALKVVTSILFRCEKIQPKFMVGTSQHTLLENRIKALAISKSLITETSDKDRFSPEELHQALRPIASIIRKCEKAQLKFDCDRTQHKRFTTLIAAMNLSKDLIMNEISRSV